jgi:hypothetical protein
MKDPLVRFGVALERSLLRELDDVVRERMAGLPAATTRTTHLPIL